MAIDIDNRLKDAKLPYFSSGDATLTRVGVNPTLLLASDFPITIGRDGNLYYPWLPADEQLQIFRLAPFGTTTILKASPANRESGPLRWLNGIAAAPDGSVYYTENRAVRRITSEGKLTTVAENVTLSGCDSMPGIERDLGPYFRGLDVDAQATVYVAATGCRSVLKITPQGNVSTILRSPGLWAPAGIAVFEGEVYVLEWRDAPTSCEAVRSDWIPRVRKVGHDGVVTILATVSR